MPNSSFFDYADFACVSSQGRIVPEAEETGMFARSAFQRDRDRIIHSVAFRRLKHKTQVFLYHEGIISEHGLPIRWKLPR